MDQGEGRGAANKVLDAASRDPNVVIITADIEPQGSAIGQLKMGLSLEGINQDLRVLEEEFSGTIQGSKFIVVTVLVVILMPLVSTLYLHYPTITTMMDHI